MIMRKLIMLALMAATVMPVAAPAAAQSRGEIRRDRQELREERQELRDARRYGDRRDIREERRDVRDARRELREDLRDRHWGRNDWRDYRRGNGDIYRRGHWRAPFAYRVFRPGLHIAPSYYGSRYYIADPWRYRLPLARPGLRWIRHYDDALLVDVRRGIVIDVIRNFYW
jgi:Ni/Co efflux regulator RcnB